MDRRGKLIDGLDLQTAVGVEIGALCNPILTKADAAVIYVDYADADTLRRHYHGNPHVDPAKIVETDVIWGAKTLKESLNREIDFVIASHVVEHVPDLVAWLNELHSVLSPSGEIRLAVPDRRFTFDFLRRETQLAEVLAAHLTHPRAPQPYFILDYFLNAIPIDAMAAWRGDIHAENLSRTADVRRTLERAKNALETGVYCDAHCWVFTPYSFATLMEQLAAAGLISLSCEQFFDTERDTIEFFVALRPCEDRARVVDSWRRMAETCNVEAPDTSESTAISDLTDQLSMATEALAATQADVERLQQTLNVTEARLQNALKTIESIHHSSSWRVTEPLRKMKTTLNRRASR